MDQSMTDFGRESFPQLRLRKLFGTVIYNIKGDRFIPSDSTRIVFAYTSQILEMDIDRLFAL